MTGQCAYSRARALAQSGHRRRFLHAAGAGALSLLGLPAHEARAEPPPETTRIRLIHTPIICVAPLYVGEALLRQEGFTHIEYVPTANGKESGQAVVAQGRADFTQWDTLAMYPEIERGHPLRVLASIHASCQELIANDRVRNIREIRGRRIGISTFGNGDHWFLASALAYIGIRPDRDVTWVSGAGPFDAATLFEEGKADAFLGFAPQPQKLRQRGLGHTLLKTVSDRPWSQYFCCMVAGNADFVARHPVATKRALRALLKAADLCGQKPDDVAQFMLQKGYEPDAGIAREVLVELPYRRWRESNPADTLRFHALRLRDVGMIQSTPQQIIERGADFRFFEQLKRELKA